MEYTKGEWKASFNPSVTGPTPPAVTTVCGGRDWPYRTVNVGTETIAICPAQDTNRMHQPNIDEAIANARLIASAPDLYEACKETLEWFNSELADAYITQGIMLKFPSLPKVALAIAKAGGK